MLDTARPLLHSARPTFADLRGASIAGVPLLAGLEPSLARLNSDILPWLGKRDTDTRVLNYESIGPTFSVLDKAAAEFDHSGLPAAPLDAARLGERDRPGDPDRSAQLDAQPVPAGGARAAQVKPRVGLLGGHFGPARRSVRRPEVTTSANGSHVDKAEARKMIDRERLALEMRRASGPSMALLALIIASVICTAIIFQNNGITLPWDGTYTRQIALDNAKGIVPKRQTVRIAGVTVGRIEAIGLVHGSPVATISIDAKYAPLYRNAQIRLRPETPLDDMYLDIVSRGTPSAGALPAAQVLPAQRTQIPVDISSVLDVFNADTRSRVQASIDALGEGLGAQGDELQAGARRSRAVPGSRQAAHAADGAPPDRDRPPDPQLLARHRRARPPRRRRFASSSPAAPPRSPSLAATKASVQAVINQLPPTMRQLESTFATVQSAADHLDPGVRRAATRGRGTPQRARGADAVRRGRRAGAGEAARAAARSSIG